MAGTFEGLMIATVGGTPIAAQGNTSPDVNAGITVGEVANGTPFNQGFVYKAGSKATATFEAPWASGTTVMADTSLVLTPKACSFAWPVGGVTFGSALEEQFTISSKGSSFVMVQTTYLNEGEPTAGGSGGGGGGPTASPPLHYAATVSTMGGSSTGVGSFDLIWANTLIAFYGNTGSSYPVYIRGPVKASGKFSQLFQGTAELLQILGACPSTGTMSFAVAAACGSASFGSTCNGVYYVDWKISQSFSAATMEDVSFQMITTDGGITPPLVIS